MQVVVTVAVPETVSYGDAMSMESNSNELELSFSEKMSSQPESDEVKAVATTSVWQSQVKPKSVERARD